MSLKLEKVSKRYFDKWVLRDLSVEVARGEVFGLIGAASSGRTTILKLIAGHIKDYTGKISFEDAEVKDAVLVGAESQEEKSLFRRILPSKQKSDLFSENERRLEEFKRALDEANSVLLLDNPFACFDEKMREEALQQLRETTQQKNLSVILVTNNTEEIFGGCDRIGILHRGDIIQVGEPREVYEKPDYVASASLLGRCNLITARRVTFSNEEIPEFQTLEGGHRIKTDKVERRRLGAITQNVTLAIRPEHVCINFGAAFPEDNLLKAKVLQIDFRGETTRVKLDADGLLIEAVVLRLVGLNVGDDCMIGLPPNRITILRS